MTYSRILIVPASEHRLFLTYVHLLYIVYCLPSEEYNVVQTALSVAHRRRASSRIDVVNHVAIISGCICALRVANSKE